MWVLLDFSAPLISWPLGLVLHLLVSRYLRDLLPIKYYKLTSNRLLFHGPIIRSKCIVRVWRSPFILQANLEFRRWPSLSLPPYIPLSLSTIRYLFLINITYISGFVIIILADCELQPRNPFLYKLLTMNKSRYSRNYVHFIKRVNEFWHCWLYCL